MPLELYECTLSSIVGTGVGMCFGIVFLLILGCLFDGKTVENNKAVLKTATFGPSRFGTEHVSQKCPCSGTCFGPFVFLGSRNEAEKRYPNNYQHCSKIDVKMQIWAPKMSPKAPSLPTWLPGRSWEPINQ